MKWSVASSSRQLNIEPLRVNSGPYRIVRKKRDLNSSGIAHRFMSAFDYSQLNNLNVLLNSSAKKKKTKQNYLFSR